MAIYGPHMLALAVLAITTSQIFAHFVLIPSVYVQLDNPIEKCRSLKLGDPNPICASDGYTYYNFENLNCLRVYAGSQIEFGSFGECNATAMPVPRDDLMSGCSCMKYIGYDTQINQFCGSDGFTYYSQSEADCISSCYGYPIVKVSNGPCTVPYQCNCQFSKLASPICGSDGLTYENREALACSNYCKKQRVQEQFSGKCGGIYRKGK